MLNFHHSKSSDSTFWHSKQLSLRWDEMYIYQMDLTFWWYLRYEEIRWSPIWPFKSVNAARFDSFFGMTILSTKNSRSNQFSNKTSNCLLPFEELCRGNRYQLKLLISFENIVLASWWQGRMFTSQLWLTYGTLWLRDIYGWKKCGTVKGTFGGPLENRDVIGLWRNMHLLF